MGNILGIDSILMFLLKKFNSFFDVTTIISDDLFRDSYFL